MAKRPGHVEVVTEVGFCNFCNRSRNLRREEHHLGGLVRTIVSCETCHRTLSSTMGVAAEQPAPEPETEAAPPEMAASEQEPKRPAAKKAPDKKAPAKKAPAKKASAKKAAAGSKTPPPKPRSTATRKTSRTR
jgi:hypothetical protein